MAMIIGASIDVDKLSAAIKAGKGVSLSKSNKRYLALSIMVNDVKDEYNNDCNVSIGQSKEEREAKVNKEFVGNGKIFWQGTRGGNKPAANNTPASPPPVNNGTYDDSLPF